MKPLPNMFCNIGPIYITTDCLNIRLYCNPFQLLA